MSVTTIKVDAKLRDRLASVARARGVTMTALLSDVVARLEADQRWAEIDAAYARVQHDDPESWAEYLGELAEWQSAEAEPDNLAAREWPEYNG
jgi:predicted transcriptional regulator